MGFFSWKSAVSGHDIMNDYNDHGLYDGMAIILPDNTIISGEYDGYGKITDVDGMEHDVYALIAYHMFGVKDRNLIFGGPKEWYEGSNKLFITNKFNWEEPLDLKDITAIDGYDIKSIVGKTMNQLQRELSYRTVFGTANSFIKVMHRSEVYEGMLYKDLPVSEGAEGQGFWSSSYETRVDIYEEE